jgi:hypothetical protein
MDISNKLSIIKEIYATSFVRELLWMSTGKSWC